MSKTSVRKFIATLDADQLREMILDLYSARKEAKELLDYYADPDLDQKREEIETALGALLVPRKGRFSPKSTPVKELVKRFASYGPPDDIYVDFMQQIFGRLIACMRKYYFKSAFANLAVWQLVRTLDVAGGAGMLPECVAFCKTEIDTLADNFQDTAVARRLLADQLEDYVRQKALD